MPEHTDPAGFEPAADPSQSPAGSGQPVAGRPEESGTAGPPGQDDFAAAGQGARTEQSGQPGQFGQAPSYDHPATYGRPAFDQPARVLSAEPSPILLGFPPAARQRRLTVAFRAPLAVPHVIVLYVLNLAAEVVLFIGWFAALFTGQLPGWAHDFLTGVLRWQSRVYAYTFLLTDQYPPFSLEDEDTYPVRVLTRPTRLNRLAVFFRLLLVIPAGIVSALVVSGMVGLSFFAWLIALAGARLPEPLHQAIAATVRYAARLSGYLYLVTSRYPNGLYGDKADLTASPAAAQPGAADAMQAGDLAGLAGDAPVLPLTVPGPWRLTLTGGARTLVTVFGVAGLVVMAGYIAFVASLGHGAATGLQKTQALTQVYAANDVLAQPMGGFASTVEACNKQLTCVTKADTNLGSALITFSSSIAAVPVPSADQLAAANLAAASKTAGTDLTQLGSSTTAEQYQTYAESDGLQTTLDQVASDYTKLVKDLGGRV
jgi:hypothetical protein